MEKPTIEEVLELVSFERDEDGNLQIYNVCGNVRGSVCGSVHGSVHGNVRISVCGNVGCDVWGNVFGKILNSL